MKNNQTIYLIYCPKCNEDTGLATINKDNLNDMPYMCIKCGHKDEKAINYRIIEREKYLEGHEEVEDLEKEKGGKGK